LADIPDSLAQAGRIRAGWSAVRAPPAKGRGCRFYTTDHVINTISAKSQPNQKAGYSWEMARESD
jgi:hypothetical protein